MVVMLYVLSFCCTEAYMCHPMVFLIFVDFNPGKVNFILGKVQFITGNVNFIFD